MDGKKLDLNLLLALEALLAESNVTRAARRLNLSQSALSAQLARLRSLFGDQLLIPTSRGMLPTAKATELQAPLRQALDQVRSVVSGAKGFDPATADFIFSISSSDYMQISILLPLLLRMNEAFPALRVMLRQAHNSRTVSAELQSGDTDVAFLQTQDVENTDLRYLEVLSEKYVGIARKGTVPEGAMCIDRFVGLRQIIVSPRAEGFSGSTDDALAARGLSRQVAFAVSSFVFLVEAVSRCDLVAMAPARLAARYADRIDTFEPPVPVEGFKIAMVWHDRTHGHPARAWLRDQLASYCAGH